MATHSKASEEQLDEIQELCKRLGLYEGDVLEEYTAGVPNLEYLTIHQAKRIIEELQARLEL